jgi:hypothetical protein
VIDPSLIGAPLTGCGDSGDALFVNYHGARSSNARGCKQFDFLRMA